MESLYNNYIEYLKIYHEIGTFGGMSELAPLIKMLNDKEKLTKFEMTHNALLYFGEVLKEILPSDEMKAEEIIPYIRKMLIKFEALEDETINIKELVKLLKEEK